MASNNGPAHNTWAQQHLCETQGSPQNEEQPTIGQESMNISPVTLPAARSLLSRILVKRESPPTRTIPMKERPPMSS